MTAGRTIHIITFALLAVATWLSHSMLPSLWKDEPTAFATIGGFFTFYGVIFAVIETVRARKASELASAAAKTAKEKTVALFNLKNIGECQAAIRDTLKDLEREGWASSATLSRILELYTAEFFREYTEDTSDERQNIGALQSHAASHSGPLKAPALHRLKSTLLSMQTHLTVAANKKITEPSHDS